MSHGQGPQIPRARSGRSALEVAEAAALEAGRVLEERFRTEKRITEKGRRNIVTDVDHAVEALLIEALLREFPGFGVLAEESGKSGGDSEYAWIIDPLDGTRNYASGVPVFAVTLALARGPEVLAGVTYDPNRKELFRVERGRGATVNGAPMEMTRRPTLQASLLGTDMGYNDALGHSVLRLMDSLWPGMQGIRIIGSAALGLAYTAAGRLDIYFHHALSPWDIAAGVLMGQEAGGVVTNKNGHAINFLKDRSIVMANREVHADFLKRTLGLDWRKGEA